MKKVIVAVCLVGVAAIAAQAQTSHLYNAEAREYRRQQQQASRRDGALDSAVLRARREHEEARRRQQQGGQTSAPRATVPGFGTTALINAEGAAAMAPAPAKPAAKKKAPKKSNASAWSYVKAAFGYCPYPGETEEQYRSRISGLGAVANQPFK